MADIPGLIEGAHEGIGLGHEFLRHVERAGLLVHLVEPFPADESDPISNYRNIRQELKLYSAELGERPEIVVMSKCELPGANEVLEKLRGDVGDIVMPISAVTGEGLNKLLQVVADKLDEQRQAREEAEEQAARRVATAAVVASPAPEQVAEPGDAAIPAP